MGYNRSGHRRTQRLKRQKREITRLVAKLAAAQSDTAAAPAAAKKVAAKE